MKYNANNKLDLSHWQLLSQQCVNTNTTR